MKKILSILLITLAALVGNFNTSAQSMALERGKVKFKFNVKDVVTEEPVSGAKIQLYIQVRNSGSGAFERKPFLLTSESNSAGEIFGYISYTENSNQGGKLGGNDAYYIWAPGSGGNAYVSLQTIDFDPSPSTTYSYDLPPATTPRIRNLISATNATKVYQNVYGGFDNCYLSGNWLTQGAAIEFDVYVRDNSTTRTVGFDKSEISNASAFTDITVPKGSVFNVSSITTTPLCVYPANVFDYWSIDGTTPFESATMTSNITLKPVWKASGPREGKINFKVFMWDHDAYMRSPKIYYPLYGQGYTHQITGKNGVNTVMSNFELSDYWTNSGWTDTKVCNLRFTVRTYPHQSGAPDNPRQIGEITTDENGEATLTLSNSEMNDLEVGYIIDTDPDPTSLGYIDMETELGTERLYCVFNYDWMSIADVQNAGLMGVRYIPEGTRHDLSLIHI